MPRVPKKESERKQILEITTKIAASLVQIVPSNTTQEKVAIVKRAHEIANIILSTEEDNNG